MVIESKVCNFGWEAIDFKLKSIDEKYYSLDNLYFGKWKNKFCTFLSNFFFSN